jgi:hypothetical protein
MGKLGKLGLYKWRVFNILSNAIVVSLLRHFFLIIFIRRLPMNAKYYLVVLGIIVALSSQVIAECEPLIT